RIGRRLIDRIETLRQFRRRLAIYRLPHSVEHSSEQAAAYLHLLHAPSRPNLRVGGNALNVPDRRQKRLVLQEPDHFGIDLRAGFGCPEFDDSADFHLRHAGMDDGADDLAHAPDQGERLDLVQFAAHPPRQPANALPDASDQRRCKALLGIQIGHERPSRRAGETDLGLRMTPVSEIAVSRSSSSCERLASTDPSIRPISASSRKRWSSKAGFSCTSISSISGKSSATRSTWARTSSYCAVETLRRIRFWLLMLRIAWVTKLRISSFSPTTPITFRMLSLASRASSSVNLSRH